MFLMISCEQYDYIEVACMYNYKLKLNLKSGAEIYGVAIDTARNDQSEECIKIKIDDQYRLIILDSISYMQVLDVNASFASVRFS